MCGGHRRWCERLWNFLLSSLWEKKVTVTEIKSWPRWNSNRVPLDPKSQSFQLSHKALDELRWLKRLFVFGFFLYFLLVLFYFIFCLFWKNSKPIRSCVLGSTSHRTFARCPRVVPSAAPRALRSGNALRFLCSVEPRTQLLILTRWVPYDGYIRHQKDHLSGRMTDISVMGEWKVAGVGGTRPLRNVLGEALKGRFSFEARKYLFSFQSYVHFEEFFCFPRFCKIWRQTFKLWSFWFRRCFGAFFENSALSPGIFCEPWIWPRDLFLKISFIFSKQSRCHLPDSCGGLQAEQSTFVMVRRKLEWKLDFRTLARSSAERIVDHRRDRYESLAVIHGPKEKKKQWSQRVIARSINPASFTKSASFRSLFRRTNVATVLHFTVFLYVEAQLQVGQAAARGESEEKQSSVTLPVLVTQA